MTTIVPFGPEHLEVAARLYIAVFNAPPWHDRWTLTTARRRLAETLTTPNALGFALLDDDLVGFVLGYAEPWFGGTHFYLKEMCIRTDRQRLGLGTRLLRYLEQALQEQRVDRVYLLTAQEGPASAFYAKQGYYVSPRMQVMAHRLTGGEAGRVG